jgi:hypothetical protein
MLALKLRSMQKFFLLCILVAASAVAALDDRACPMDGTMCSSSAEVADRCGPTAVALPPGANPAVPCCAKQEYEKVCEKLKELNSLEGISGLLGWDEMVRAPHAELSHTSRVLTSLCTESILYVVPLRRCLQNSLKWGVYGRF